MRASVYVHVRVRACVYVRVRACVGGAGGEGRDGVDLNGSFQLVGINGSALIQIDSVHTG